MSYECRIILDSLAPSGGRLTTLVIRAPRIILAEFNTHRIFSRNSASSRAIPVAKMREMIASDPFVPSRFPQNEKGMQPSGYLDDETNAYATMLWEKHRVFSLGIAKFLSDAGVHKQIANRLAEPHSFHTIVVSATHWANFLALRNSAMAQEEIRIPAQMLAEALAASVPKPRAHGEWHLPFVEGYDLEELRHERGLTDRDLVKISTARCARVSYMTQEGVRDPREDLAMYDRLVEPGHMSPLEHPARALDADGWCTYAQRLAEDWIALGIPVGNFWGWAQHRKDVAFEDDHSKFIRKGGA